MNSRDIEQLEIHAAEMRAKAEKLQAFKDYVHSRLDLAGVPTDPESPHKAEGCRIGGRLDWLIERAGRVISSELAASLRNNADSANNEK